MKKTIIGLGYHKNIVICQCLAYCINYLPQPSASPNN